MKKSSSNATWGGRFSEGPSDLMLRFSESVSFDQRLARFDVLGSKAHASMLARAGILSTAERDAILCGLDAILSEINAGNFHWDTTLEDVHMNIEQALTRRIGATAARLHTARSRNDQVATDMRLFFKDAAARIQVSISRLLCVLVEVAERERGVFIPGYTHLQRAQPVSVAHHLLAYVEMFGRDRERFEAFAGRANWCPLGSGAIAGTTLPVDREFVAKQLGFVDARGRPQVTPNSMDAVADRDLFIEFASACALAGVHFSRVAEDLILWSSSEFGYAVMPDAFTTGSSLMPQKKNPDSLELLRGKAARLQGNLVSLLVLTKGLPLTYNRDLQEDKPPVFDSLDTVLACMDVLRETLRGMRLDASRCAAAVSDPMLLATDLADYLVRKGVPFRDAHHAVGAVVALAEKSGVPLNKLTLDAVRGVNKNFGADWVDTFDLKTAMRARERPGMPGPRQVSAQINKWRKRLAAVSQTTPPPDA